MAEYTPMMRQYFEIKNQYKDCILLYRLGDFYEMFFDDALTASKILDITLTGRDCGQEERAPMCGVPFHSADSYIARLVESGYNVAVCEQVENPSDAKGIVKRDVIRIITPGTIMDTSALDDGKNNYLCSLYISEDGAGISFVDITTGEISVNAFTGNELEMKILNEMVKFSPAEVIVNNVAFEDERLMNTISERFGCMIKNSYSWAFEHDEACKKIESQFGKNINEFGFAEQVVSSLGALLLYLESTQKAELTNLNSIDTESEAQYMELDVYSMRNLELLETMREKKAKGSLLNILNLTKTSMGSRLLRKWITAPLVNCTKIQNRHVAVSELLEKPIIREEIINSLKSIQDIERIMGKIAYNTANGRDLIAISDSIEVLPNIKNLISQCVSGVFSKLIKSFDTLEDIKTLISESIDENAPFSVREGNMIKDGYNSDIDNRRKIIKDGKSWINNVAEEEKEKTGIKNIKVGYNRVFGYYLEISKVNSKMAPDYFVRKQTLSNCERYITPQIKQIEEMILEAEGQIVNMEYEMFCQIREKIASQIKRIQDTAHVIAVIDVLCSFAAVAEKNGYVMPVMNMSDKIIIKDGRHPVIEKLGNESMFIPNDVKLDGGENQISIITGPNMAGKSTYMRQVALIVLMAQMGSFVPASSAEIGIVDKIFTRVGASDDLAAGQSTFMVEMSEVAYILNNATNRSLVILDEIGRGTSTYDGLSIAWAVVEYMSDKKKCGAKTLFATHYHELTGLEEKIYGVKNYCIAVKKHGDDITFLRKIIRGGADDSYGIEVAALAGVKRGVIKRAKNILSDLESRDGNGENVSVKNSLVDKSKSSQIDFLALTDNEVISELKKLDLNVMTPVEALTKLFDFQAKAKAM